MLGEEVPQDGEEEPLVVDDQGRIRRFSLLVTQGRSFVLARYGLAGSRHGHSSWETGHDPFG
jgi:hypothetical protein